MFWPKLNKFKTQISTKIISNRKTFSQEANISHDEYPEFMYDSFCTSYFRKMLFNNSLTCTSNNNKVLIQGASQIVQVVSSKESYLRGSSTGIKSLALISKKNEKDNLCLVTIELVRQKIFYLIVSIISFQA